MLIFSCSCSDYRVCIRLLSKNLSLSSTLFSSSRSFREFANELGVKMSLETIIFLGCNLSRTFPFRARK
jgi:hypothetical protein